MNLLNHKTGRRVIAFTFYFAEGAPIGFIWWALPTLLRRNDIEISTIGTLTAMLTLPWVLKFLWAPLIDVLRTRRFGFKTWIAASQLLMCLVLIPLIFIPLPGNIIWWGTILFLHSIFAATQDVCIDALVINTVVKEERGTLNGYMQAGMLLGRSLFGGGALYMVPKLGLSTVVLIMIATIFCILLLLLFIKEPENICVEKERFSHFKNNLRATFLSEKAWLTIAFILTSAAACEAVGAMSGPYLKDKTANIELIGFFFGIPAVIAMLLGGLMGGFISDRMSRKNSLRLFLCCIVSSVVLISVIDLIYPELSIVIWMACFCIMYFFTGAFTASSYAFYMDVTNPMIGASEFSAFMAAVNACEAWVVWTTGMIISYYNYSTAFLVMCMVSLCSLFFLSRIKEK